MDNKKVANELNMIAKELLLKGKLSPLDDVEKSFEIYEYRGEGKFSVVKNVTEQTQVVKGIVSKILRDDAKTLGEKAEKAGIEIIIEDTNLHIKTNGDTLWGTIYFYTYDYNDGEQKANSFCKKELKSMGYKPQ